LGEPITKSLENFGITKLVGYFLLLWAATFFFSAINGFIYVAEGYGSAINILVDGLWSLADLGCAAILAMLGFKILGNQ
jgi:hypothetical protein